MNDVALAPFRQTAGDPALKQQTVAVVGLGYVGLPLAVEFGKQFATVGFDLSAAKVEAYRKGLDPTGEVTREQLAAATRLECTTDAGQLRHADFVIIAVPTPVDDAHQPDFSPLVAASARASGSPLRCSTTAGGARLTSIHASAPSTPSCTASAPA